MEDNDKTLGIKVQGNGTRFITYKQVLAGLAMAIGVFLAGTGFMWQVHASQPHSGAVHLHEFDIHQAEFQRHCNADDTRYGILQDWLTRVEIKIDRMAQKVDDL